MFLSVRFSLTAVVLFTLSCKTIIVPESRVSENLFENLNAKVEVTGSEMPEKLDLEQAKAIALRENPGLQASEQRILRAKAVIYQAKSLYFPTLKATFNARHQHNVSQGRIPFPTQPYETYQSALSSQWLIFDGFAREYKVLAARYGEISAKESFQDSQRLLVDAVSQSFYRTILSQKEMSINLELKNINLKFLKDTETRLEAGTSTRTEVNNFLVNVNDSQIAYLEAQNSFETSKVVLAELLGMPNADLSKFEAVFKQKTISVPDKNSAIKTALENRQDLKALQSEILAIEAQVNEAQGEYYPKFYLEGSYGTSSIDEARFGDDKRDSYIGAALSWDLFTGNSTAALIARRKAEKEEKLKLLKSQWFETISQIRQQRQSLLNVIEKVKVQSSTAALTKSIYDDTETVYNNGATTITRVNEVLANYSVAKLNQALFEVEALRRKAVLDSLMGINLKK